MLCYVTIKLDAFIVDRKRTIGMPSRENIFMTLTCEPMTLTI